MNHGENDVPIGELEVAPEARRALESVGIELTRDLDGKRVRELMAIPGFSAEWVDEVRRALARRGYRLRD